MFMIETEAQQLETAIRIAVLAHQGQRDKSGQPYVLHVLRVMLNTSCSLAKQAAVLHDTVEDTSTTMSDLAQSGIASQALEAVRLLTHNDGSSYADYVCRLKPNPIAREVKLADLNDNYRLDRVAYRAEHAAQDALRIQKYILTRQYLCDELTEVEYRSRMQTIDG